MLQRFLLAVVLMATFCGQAHAAAPFKVSALLERCRVAERFIKGEDLTPTESNFAGMCVGYLWGITDGLSITCAASQALDRAARQQLLRANTERVTGGALVRAFILWAEAHPEQWEENVFVAALAFDERFPCPE
jgi:hypothetical protein